MRDYLKNSFFLDEIVVEKDLGVVWQNNLKWREHINRAKLRWMPHECLEERRKRGDKIQMFKIYKNFNKIDLF